MGVIGKERKLAREKLKKQGKDPNKEHISDKPVAVPLGCSKPESLHKTMQRLFKQMQDEALANQALESPEDADDFDVGDDFDPQSPYEYDFDPALKETAHGENTQFVEESPSSSGPGKVDNQSGGPDTGLPESESTAQEGPEVGGAKS
jgi:hypothetical protein